MGLTREEKISLDFNSAQIKTIRLHQWDHLSTKIIVSCTDSGNFVNIPNDGTVVAQIKWLKPDNTKVFKEVTVNSNGTITIPTDEQMLIVSGTVKAELQLLGTGCILHTMPFHVVVIGETFSNSEAASKDEVTALTEAMAHITDAVEISKQFPTWQTNEQTRQSNEQTRQTNEQARQTNTATAISNAESATQAALDAAGDVTASNNYALQSKSYAVGETGIRTDEDMDNAKFYSEQANASSIVSAASEAKAKVSETNAKASEDNAKVSENNSKTSETNAKASEDNAKASELAGATSETNAKNSEDMAEYWKNQAKQIAGGDFVITGEYITNTFIDSLFE